MQIEISTPALLFPAISLLFLAYTTRYLNLAALIRTLHRDWQQRRDASLRAQIANLRTRLELIRWMQLLGASSLLACIAAMAGILAGAARFGFAAFSLALALMATSLLVLVAEIAISGGALRIMLNTVQYDERRKPD